MSSLEALEPESSPLVSIAEMHWHYWKMYNDGRI